ncbi:hypothetical protein Tco_1298540 [Tanacetum coccineum]
MSIIVVVGTELADAYSAYTVIASSPGKEVYDPWAFYLHAALLRQAFAHCGKFPTAASHRSLAHVSVPMWLIILSDQLLIIAVSLNYIKSNKNVIGHRKLKAQVKSNPARLESPSAKLARHGYNYPFTTLGE